MRLASLSFAALFVFILASACSTATDPTIYPKSYDTSCTVASDCAPVEEGDVCGCMACSSNAINKRDHDKYEADRNALQQQCPPRSGENPFCPAACLDWEVTCIAGKCGACQFAGCSGAGDAGAADAAHD